MHKVGFSFFLLYFFSRLAFGTNCNFVKESADVYWPTGRCIGSYDYGTNSSIMYTCSTNGKYVNLTTYDSNIDCMGTPSSWYMIYQNDTYYEGFVCNGTDCSLQYSLATYDSSSSCSGSFSFFELDTFVTNVCYYISSSESLEYTCSSSSFTAKSYSDSSCSSSSPVVATYKSGCTSLDSVSYDYKITHCGNPTGSSPSFSTFMSFVVMAIAFFIC